MDAVLPSRFAIGGVEADVGAALPPRFPGGGVEADVGSVLPLRLLVGGREAGVGAVAGGAVVVGAGGADAARPLASDSVISHSARHRPIGSPASRHSSSTASRGGSVLPLRYRSHDDLLYGVFAASPAMLSPVAARNSRSAAAS